MSKLADIKAIKVVLKDGRTEFFYDKFGIENNATIYNALVAAIGDKLGRTLHVANGLSVARDTIFAGNFADKGFPENTTEKEPTIWILSFNGRSVVDWYLATEVLSCEEGTVALNSDKTFGSFVANS